MIKRFKPKRALISLVLVASVLGTGTSLKLHRDSEVKRIKGYLEDFQTPSGYVDMTKIDPDYEIEPFQGKYLADALKETDVTYVRIADNFIYNGNHVTPFKYYIGQNKDEILGIDEDNNPVYQSVNPIIEEGPIYDIPLRYELTEVSEVCTTPIRYNSLKDYEVDIVDYEDNQSLVLKKSK